MDAAYHKDFFFEPTAKGRALANSENWLISHLADKAENIKLLNSILRPELGHLPKASILKKAEKIGNRVQLFDGEILLPDDFKLQSLATPDELASEIAELESEKARISQLLEATRNRAALEKQRSEALEAQKQLERHIQLASQLDQIGQDIKGLMKEMDKLTALREKTEKKLRQLDEDVERLLELSSFREVLEATKSLRDSSSRRNFYHLLARRRLIDKIDDEALSLHAGA